MDLLFSSLQQTGQQLPLAFLVLSTVALAASFVAYSRGVRGRYMLVAASAWWMLVVVSFAPHGFNYNIYRHNASLTLAGEASFARGPEAQVDYQSEPWAQPVYLDYTGATHLAYTGLAAVDLSGSDWLGQNLGYHRLSGLGFQLWSLVWGLVVLVLFYKIATVRSEWASRSDEGVFFGPRPGQVLGSCSPVRASPATEPPTGW